MASPASEVYLPPLERCLKDQTLLFTWRDVYISIQDVTAELPPGVRRFLKDPESLKLLKRPLQPFEDPSSGTKSRFDHLTAAINITPDENATYDIGQIKEDALWLSTTAKIDEVSALRIAVIEWQRRPVNDLLSLSPDTESTNGSADIFEKLNESMFSRPAAKDHEKGQKAADGTSKDCKAQRQAEMLLSSQEEKAYLLATSRLLLSLRKSTSRPAFKIVDDLLSVQSDMRDSCLPQEDGSAFIARAIQTVERVLSSADALLDHLAGNEDAQKRFTEALALQFVSLFELIVTIADLSAKVLSADAVKPFFSLMINTEYFTPVIAQVTLSCPALGSALQGAISLAGPALFKLPLAVRFLALEVEDRGILTAPEVRGLYMFSTETLEVVQESLFGLAEVSCPLAAYALLGWSIVLLHLARFKVEILGEEDDDQAELNLEIVPQQDAWRIEALHSAYLRLKNGRRSLREVANPLYSAAVSRLGVFDQLSNEMARLDQQYGQTPSAHFGDICRALLYDLMHLSRPLSTYDSGSLEAFMATVGGVRSFWDSLDRPSGAFDELAEYVAEGILTASDPLFETIRTRYPQEMAPFHRLITALLSNCNMSEARVSAVIDLVTHSESLTMRLPSGWDGYEEDTSALDEVPALLTRDLPIFYSQRAGVDFLSRAITSSASTTEFTANSDLMLPAGLTGRVVSDRRPPVIMFQKSFSPLRFMVGCLCTATPGNDFVEASTSESVPLDDVVDILGLLSSVLLATHKSGLTSDISLLDEGFSDAEPSKNLLQIVGELFELHLETLSLDVSASGSIEVLMQCMSFFNAVALTHPTRLWALLARSSLLEIDGNGGSLAVIVSSLEMVSGQYDFLVACIRLFDALVDASLWSGAVETETRALTRFSERRAQRGVGESLPQRVASTVMTSFSKTLLEAFMSSRSWRYSTSTQRSEISTKLANTFDKILHYVFGTDHEPDPHRKTVTAVLADAAKLIVQVLITGSASHGIADTLVGMLRDAVGSVTKPSFVLYGSASKQAVLAATNLATTVALIRSTTSPDLSTIEKELFGASPVLARLFVGYGKFKTPIANLQAQLVLGSAALPNESPALLGGLSSKSSRNFLTSLGYLDAPFDEARTELEVWRMLSAVVSSKQTWFAISLLTGEIPKDRAKSTGEKRLPARTISLFSYALNALSNTELADGRPIWRDLPSELASEMLRFIADCQNHWSWAVSELGRNFKFIDAITKSYIRHLHRDPGDAVMSMATEASIAATIAEILAMHLYSSARVGEAKAADKIIDHLQYFQKFGIASPKYNKSLHENLGSHLARQHKGLRLDNFKRTLTFPAQPGSEYYYDISFASRVLNAKRTATGKSLKGFEQDLIKANEDLSFVDAQIALLKSWKLLATELAKHVKADTKLSALLLDVVADCLRENASSSVPAAIFAKLRYQRLDLALNLSQKLITLPFKDVEQSRRLKELFSITWEAIRANSYNFDSVFADPDVQYYRGLLQILFTTLRPLTQMPSDPKRNPHSHPPTQAAELIEILVNVIIKGFKSLTTILHEDATLVSPSDFVLLTAMLQNILNIPGINLLFSDISLHLSTERTSTHATSLFSWSDQFLIDGDPIYGELAILFLLELSTIPAAAESLAVDGVLSQLASARIMQLYTRPRGMGPFDNPPRLHSIWSRGILPLCLNLLDVVGAPVAAELVSFLNNYPTQLARLAAELGNRSSPVGTRPADSHITLSTAAETHSLSLLWLVLERYRAAGSAAGAFELIPPLDWDLPSIKEDVEDFVLGRSALGPLVVPGNEREAELARLKPAGGGKGSRLEEKVLRELVAANECFSATIVG